MNHCDDLENDLDEVIDNGLALIDFIKDNESSQRILIDLLRHAYFARSAVKTARKEVSL